MTPILLVTYSWTGGGAQAVCRAWSSVLKDLGYVVHVVLLQQREVPEPEDFAGADRIFAADGRAPIGLAGKFRYLSSLLRKQHYQAIISLETLPNLMVIAATRARLGAIARPKVIISEHNVTTILLREEGGAKKVQLVLARLAYRFADHAIAVSHASATDLRSNFALVSRRITVLPNPIGVLVDAETRLQEASKIADLHKSLGEAAERIELLVPARLVPQKRPDLVLQIAQKLRLQGISATVRWVGDARSQEYAEQFADATDFLHERWDPEWASNADNNTVVLLASDYEGFGNVLVEAAMASIPVVAGSAALGCIDAVVPGVSGEFAESDTTESYVAAVKRAMHLKDKTRPAAWFVQFGMTSTRDKMGRMLCLVLG